MELRTLVVACFLGAALAGPIARDDSTCAQSCSKPSSELVEFQDGQTLVFSYQSSTQVKLSGKHDKPIDVKMSAQVEVAVLHDCDMVMRLRNVQMHSARSESFVTFKSQLEQHPLVFALNEGKIDSLCPTEEEDDEALNIKRAILSHLQFAPESMEEPSTVQERDILGVCETVYKPSKPSSRSQTFIRTKDINSCQNNQDMSLQSFSTPYTSPNSPIQNLPILNGESICQHVVGSNKRLMSVECKQQQILKPLSSQSGVEVVIQTNLKYVSTRRGVDSAVETGVPSDLLYASAPQSEDGNARDARQALQKLCETTEEGVQIRTPYHLSGLVQALKDLPQQQIKNLYQQLQNGQPCSGQFTMDLFIDACHMAGTKGPLKFIATLIQDGKLSNARVQTFFTALAFNRHADESVIRAFLPFVKDISQIGRQAIFGITGMVNNFCNSKQFQNNTKDCRDVPAVQELIQALQNILGNKCQAKNEEDEDDQIVALIGFKNLGRVGQAKETIVKCFTRQENSVEVRVAALRAFNAVPSKPAAMEKMREVLKDRKEDHEVRIHAFMALMTWANEDTVDEVISMLENEPVNQVTAFQWTYMTNMRESSSPLRSHLRKLIENKKLRNKYHEKLGQYSKFVEWSLYSSRLNYGGAVEASIINKENSIIPASLLLNSSLQAFGNSYQILEVDLRVEGLDTYAERLFGPKGMLRNLSLQDLKDMLTGNSDNDEDDEEDSRSYKRRGEKRNNKLKSRKEEKPEAALGLSILGRTIARFTLEDIESLNSVGEAMSLMGLLEELSNKQEVERSFSTQVLDTKLSMPTVSGMKVEIALNATATVGIKANGVCDVKDLVKNVPHPNVNIEGKISPSAALEIVAHFILHAGGGSQPGLKAVFQVHTTQVIEGKIQMKNGKVVVIRIDTPKQEIPLATVKYELYKRQQSGEEEPIHSSGNYQVNACSEHFSKALGMEVCIKAKAPNPTFRKESPYLPYGGASAQIILKKTDSSMQGYEATIEIPSNKDRQERKYKIEFQTPGSRVDRHFAVEVQTKCEDDHHSISANLVAPQKQIEADLTLETGRQKIARASLVIDGNDKWAIETRLESSQNQIRPSITISTPRQQPISFKGTITQSGKGKKQQLSVDLQSNRPTNKPAYIRGTITKDGLFSFDQPEEPLRLSSDITLNIVNVDARLHASLDKGPSATAADFSAKYTVGNGREHNAKASLKVQNQGSSSFQKVSTVADFQSSQFPKLNGQMKWQFTQKGIEHVQNDISLQYGERQSEPQISVHQVSKLLGSEYDFKRGSSENSLSIVAPWFEQQQGLSVKTEWDQTKYPTASFEAWYKKGEKQVVKAAADYNVKLESPIAMSLKARLETPNRVMEYKDSIKEKSPNEYEGHTSVQWNKGKKATLDYTYRMKSDKSKAHHEVELKMMTPSMKVPMQQRALLKATGDSVDIRSQTHYEGKPVYTFDVRYSPDGESKLDIDVQDSKIHITVQNDDQVKKLKYNIQPVSGEKWTGSAEYEDSEENKEVKVSASWGEPEDTSKQIEAKAKLSMTSKRPVPQYQVECSVLIGKDVDISVNGEVSSDASVGPHEITVELKGRRSPKLSWILSHEIDSDKNVNCELTYLRDGEEHLKLQSTGKFEHDSAQTEISWALSSKSQVHSLNGKELSFRFKRDNSPLSKIGLTLRAQVAPGRPYTIFVETAQPGRNKRNIHAIVTTPLKDYISQDFTLSYQRNRKLFKIDTDATSAQGKKVQGSLKLEKEGSKITGSVHVKTPHPSLRSVSIQSTSDYSNGVMAQTNVQVNDNKKFGYNVRFANENHLDSFLELNSEDRHKYNLQLRAISDDKKRNFEYSLNRDGDEVQATKLLFKKEGRGQYNGEVVIKNEDFNWIAEASTKKSRDAQEISVSSRGVGSPFKVILKLQHDKQQFAPELSVCSPPGSGKCFLAKGSYTNQDKRGQMKRNIQLEVEQKPNLQASAEMSLDASEDYMRNHLEVKIDKVAYEWESKYDNKKDGETQLSIHLITPARKAIAEAKLTQDESSYRFVASMVPDVIRKPQEKLTLTATAQESEDQYHYTAIVNHPQMQSPKKASLNIITKERSVRPLDVKLIIELSDEPEYQYVGHIAVDDATLEKKNLTVLAEIYDQARQNVDLKIRAHVANVEDRMSAGCEWSHQNGNQKHPGSLYAEVDKEQKEFHYYLRAADNNAEGHASWEVQPGKALEFEETSIYNGEETSFKAVLSKTCLEVSTTDEQKKPSKRYRVCLTPGSDNVMTFTAESYDNEEKMTDVNVALRNQPGDRTMSAHLHWRPEKLGEIMYAMMELSEDNSIDSTGLIHGLVVVLEHVQDSLEALRDNVIAPVSQYVQKQCNAVARELQQDAKHIDKILRRVYKDLPDLSEHWDVLAEAWNDWISSLVEMIEKHTPKEVRQVVGDMCDAVSDFSSNYCSYGSNCYKLKYAYQHKGLEGVGEFLYSVIENMPDAYYKVIIALKNAAQSSFEFPEISLAHIAKTYKKVKDQFEDLLEPIWNSELLVSLRENIAQQYEVSHEVVERLLERVFECIEEVGERLKQNPQVLEIASIIKDMIEDIKKELKKMHLEEAAESVAKFWDEILSLEPWRDSINVVTMDPEGGNIEIKVRIPDVSRMRGTLKAINPFRNKSEESDEEDEDNNRRVLRALKTVGKAVQQQWIPDQFKGIF